MKKSAAGSENIFTRAALSCGSITSAFSVAVLPFFAVYCATHAHIAVAACIVLACLVPFAVMPLVYAGVHSLSSLLFGRYHLAMPLSAFLSALCFVLMFASIDGTAGEQCMLFFGALFFAAAISCYRYCAFSVRVRLDVPNFGVSLEGKIFAAVGAAAALACVYGFGVYDEQTVFINTAYVLAALVCVTTIVQYLTTFYSVPKFSGSRKMTVRQAFRGVYGGLDVRMFFAAACTAAACLTALGMGAYLCFSLALPAWTAVLAALTAVVCFIGASTLFGRLSGVTALSATSFGSAVVAAVFLIVAAAVDIGAAGATAIIAISGALVGVSLAAAVAVKRKRFVAVKPNNTVGTAFILSGLADMGATAFTAVIGAVVVGLTVGTSFAAKYVFIGAFVAAAVLAAVGFALTVSGSSIYRTDAVLPQDGAVTQDADSVAHE